jgi:hypothetical protein
MNNQSFRFKYVPVPDWPQLAWLAHCHRSRDVITVFHGSGVETTDEWFCEAAWAGDFQAGDFDQTDVVAGTGARIRPGQIVFVSSASTVDRLQSLDSPDGPWISNSLACLLAGTDARIDESSGAYYRLFRTIVRGVRQYKRLFPTSSGPVTLTYFDNLVWDGRQLSPIDKPGRGRDFSTFGRYAGFLQKSMDDLAANAHAAERRRKFEILSTASSGYDSSTVTVLAKNAGATQVLCFDQARRGQDDSGEPLAKTLGLQAVIVERSAWMAASLPEVPFLASDSHGGDVFYRGAESVLAGKILLTGYHGDKVWAKDCHSAVNEEIVRGDQSGLSLTDYRLSIGTIHCPVSFWGVRQIADIHKISNSPEMQPWDVPGDYSRPICRRIVESAGVPRESFGMEKKATWVLLHRNNNFLTPASLEDYMGWLRERRWTWLKHGRIPPALDRRIDDLEMSVRRAAGTFGYAEPAAWYKTAMHRTGLVRVLWRVGETPSRLRRFVFPWALDHQRRAYAPRPTV